MAKKRISITAYKATDGKIFEDKKEFLLYQKELDIKENIYNFVELSGCESLDVFVEYLILNKQEFSLILQNKQVTRTVVLEEINNNLNSI
jgi:hypothetical protein